MLDEGSGRILVVEVVVEVVDHVGLGIRLELVVEVELVLRVEGVIDRALRLAGAPAHTLPSTVRR